MADETPIPPQAVRFPVKNAVAPLTLRRRSRVEGGPSPLALSEASAEARRSINAIVSATRTPWGDAATLSSHQVAGLESSLRQLETRLEERERAVEEREAWLAERERDLAEMEALLDARSKVMDAARRATTSHPQANISVSAEEKAALEALKVELDRHEASLQEQKAALVERERFVEENEAKLFEKMMSQQEQETLLEQKKEELAAREKRLANLTSADPGATPQAETPARKFDEFNE